MKRILYLLLILQLFYSSAFAQEKLLSGNVKDETGTPLPGVTVLVKGTTTGTITDVDGNFRLNAPDDAQILVFQYIGYVTKEIQIGTQSTFNTSLTTDTKQLEEVVVVAYGEQKKKALTGAVGVIDQEVIKNQQVVTVTRALQGTTPGVNILTGSGQPGVGPTIRVRGIGSINASSSPLIVLDGIVFNGNINAINPNDVESINVLKDASASALYGSRAANGVLLITTKAGQIGKTDIQASVSYGVSGRAVKEYDFVSAEEYMKLAWEALKFEGQDAGLADPGQYASESLITNLAYNPYGGNYPQPIDANGNLAPGATLLWETDWEKELMQTDAQRKDVSFSVNGGSDKLKYFVSGSYLDQEGAVFTSKFERFVGRLNLDANLNSWLNLGLRTSLSYSDQNFPDQSGTGFTNNVNFIRSMSSIYPIFLRDNDGNLILDNNDNPQFDFGNAVPGRSINVNRPVLKPSNLLAETILNDLRRERFYNTFNTYMEIDFLKNFTFRTNFGLENYLIDQLDYDNPNNGAGENVNGRVLREKNLTTSWTWYNKLSFEKEFNDHYINAMAISEAYNYRYERLAGQKTKFPTFYPIKEFDAGATFETLSGYTDQIRLASFLGKVTYAFKDKYFVDISSRIDGSSRFIKEERLGSFTSVGGSWIISDEDFMPANNVINYLKLRTSYGESGNENLLDPNNRNLPIAFPYAYVFQTGYDDLDNTGIFFANLPDPLISWEKIRMLNIGLDFSLLNDRVSGTLEWYQKTTEDLIFNQPLPLSAGFANFTTNIGAMRNTGVEFALNTVNVKSATGFQWNTSFNITFEKNEITELPQGEIVVGSKKWQVGKSIYDFFIPTYAGVDPNDGAAMWLMDQKDEEGNIIGQTTTKLYGDATEYYQGSSLPKARGGLMNNLSYKGLELSFLISYSIGGKILDSDYSSMMHGFNNMGYQLNADILNRWQNPGDITDVPRLNTSNSDVAQRSTRFLFDNSYLRLRNVTLAYSLDRSILERTNLFKSARVFVQADNYLTINKRQGLDPEQALSGITNNQSTVFKTLSVGVNLGF